MAYQKGSETTARCLPSNRIRIENHNPGCPLEDKSHRDVWPSQERSGRGFSLDRGTRNRIIFMHRYSPKHDCYVRALCSHWKA